MKTKTTNDKMTNSRKRVLTEEQRLKRNAYMREYLKEYNKDPIHRKAKADYQKARYRRMKAEKANAERNKIAHEMAKRFADGLKRICASKNSRKAVHTPKVTAKEAVRKPVSVKKTVKIGRGGKKGK